MTLRTRTAALFALLLWAPLAMAAPPSEAQVDRLLEVMRAEQSANALIPQVMASQQQLIAQLTRDAEPAQRAAALEAVSSSLRSVESALSWSSLQPLYREIYMQTFTAEDTEAMVRFYSSPAGQNLLDRMPLLMQNTMAAVQTLVMPLLQQIEQDLRAKLDTPPSAD